VRYSIDMVVEAATDDRDDLPRGGKRLYQRLDSAVIELRTRLGGLPSPLEAEDIWGDIWYAEAHNSTALEGNTLVLREVALLLREGRAVGDKQLADYLEVQGYAAAAQWVYQQVHTGSGAWTTPRITLQEVRQVHHLAMTPVWEVAPHAAASADEGPGAFRRHEIQSFPGGMRPPSWTDVPAQMRSWVDRAARFGEHIHPLRDPDSFLRMPDMLAELHAEFERIHPFLDGNGRTGRLLLNLLLVRIGYPPALILKRDRTRYLDALRSADRGNRGPLGNFLAGAVLDSLYRFIVPAVAGPSRLVPLAALADRDLTHRALRNAAMRGRLKAQRGTDGQWRSTRRWVEEYKKDRYRR
jgi:hypothetical protein